MADFLDRIMTSIRVSGSDSAKREEEKKVRSHPIFYLDKVEKIGGAIGAAFIILITAIFIPLTLQQKITNSDIQTYACQNHLVAKCPKNFHLTSSQITIFGNQLSHDRLVVVFEQGAIELAIAIFIIVATFFIKRRAPLIFATILGGLVLLGTFYGLLYMGFAAWLIFRASKAKKTFATLALENEEAQGITPSTKSLNSNANSKGSSPKNESKTSNSANKLVETDAKNVNAEPMGSKRSDRTTKIQSSQTTKTKTSPLEAVKTGRKRAGKPVNEKPVPQSSKRYTPPKGK